MLLNLIVIALRSLVLKCSLVALVRAPLPRFIQHIIAELISESASIPNPLIDQVLHFLCCRGQQTLLQCAA